MTKEKKSQILKDRKVNTLDRMIKEKKLRIIKDKKVSKDKLVDNINILYIDETVKLTAKTKILDENQLRTIYEFSWAN